MYIENKETQFYFKSQWVRDIVTKLDFHRDIDRLRTDIEVTSLYDIFFQHQNIKNKK